ncbi:FAD binding domain-containing protein [Coniochaeta sp. 2T2.1]|nr:FAD binding domain-containing protein [Coniochaeta sp. 2T2.1]
MPGLLRSEAVANGDGHGHLSLENGPAQTVEIPVLIVGGGPTGLLSAYMLSKLGVKSLIIEKYPERLAAPKAHALCPRSLEICRQFGLDTDKIRKVGSPRDEAYWVNFLTNLSGERIGVLPYERMDPGVLGHTPEMIHNIPQPAFEQFVADALEHDPNVQIKKNVAFISAEQEGNTVISTLEERSTKTRWQVQSTHVLACDGARSEVRKSLGIESEGEDGYETMMTIHFKADLVPVVGDRVGMLHWITDPACSGFIIAYDLGGNQVLISNFDSTKHPADTWTQELACKTVSAAIGKYVPFQVLSYRPWLLSRKVAKEYRKGNIFLVGDAAHSFPPTGGLGLNSGIADAHNLTWKIAAVHHGWASSSLLDTYEDERRQIALVNSAQSVKNGAKIFSFLKSLGVAGIEDVDEARAYLHRSIHDPAKQEEIATEVEGQREHFDNLELHIGYVYGNKKTPPNASDFTPKFVPGARLPHAWIKAWPHSDALEMVPVDVSYVKEFGAQEIAARQFSTLDLSGIDSFTFLVASTEAWQTRFDKVRALLHQSGVELSIRSADRDFEFMDDKQKALFETGAGFPDGGGLVVRPDQHILGRLEEKMTAQDIAAVITRYLSI